MILLCKIIPKVDAIGCQLNWLYCYHVSYFLELALLHIFSMNKHFILCEMLWQVDFLVVVFFGLISMIYFIVWNWCGDMLCLKAFCTKRLNILFLFYDIFLIFNYIWNLNKYHCTYKNIYCIHAYMIVHF